jgi:hypothetical protein
MENKIRYEITAKGMLQASGRSRALPDELQQLLLLVEGSPSVGLPKETRGAEAPRVTILGLRRLADMGFIRPVALPEGRSAEPGSAGSVTSDLDFTTAAE